MSFYKVLKHTIVFKLINTVFVFLINLLLIRLLGVSASGAFFYDIAVCTFVMLLLSWSIESGLSFYASKNNQLIASLIGFVILLLLVQGLLGWIFLHFIKLSISKFFAISFITGNLAIMYFSSFLYALKKFRLINIIICVINFIITLLLFCSFHFSNLSNTREYYLSVYIEGIVVLGLVLLTCLLFSIKKIKITFTIDTLLVKNIFSYASLAFLSNVITFLVTRIDYYFVQKYCNSIALSNYIQVSKFGQLLILIPLVIASIVFPLSASDTRLMPLGKVQQLCRGITIIFIPTTILIVLTANFVLTWFYGKDFNQMYVALLIYLPGFFALSIITILAAHLAGKKQLKINLQASIAALIIVITGDFLLIPAGGINAAAAVSSVGYIAGATYLLIWYKKAYNCKVRDFIFFNKKDIIQFIHRSVS